MTDLGTTSTLPPLEAVEHNRNNPHTFSDVELTYSSHLPWCYASFVHSLVRFYSHIIPSL